jgi:hypothetical protein
VLTMKTKWKKNFNFLKDVPIIRVYINATIIVFVQSEKERGGILFVLRVVFETPVLLYHIASLNGRSSTFRWNVNDLRGPRGPRPS